jgi:hypothetical protein
MTNFSDKFIDEYRTYIVFSCKENQSIWQLPQNK